MQKLTLREIQLRELSILLYFDEFCRQNSLRYSLADGTLLGAVRHKGFIPWDDDVDVMMPRPDYERFIHLWNNNARFMLYSHRLNNLISPITKLVDRNTHVIWECVDDTFMCNHLWIDIFAVDGISEDDNVVKKIQRKNDFYELTLCLCFARLGSGRTLMRKLGKILLKPLARLYGRKHCLRNIETLALSTPYATAKKVGIIAGGSGRVKIPKSEFEKMTYFDFEGYKLPVMSCWDNYLTQLYCDYMTPPPLQNQGTHRMVAFTGER